MPSETVLKSKIRRRGQLRGMVVAFVATLILGSTVLGIAPASAASGFFGGEVIRAHPAEAELLDTINRVRTEVYGVPALENRDWGQFEGYLECIAKNNAAQAGLEHYPASCNQGFVEAEILAARYGSGAGGSVNMLVKQWNESAGHRRIMTAANANFANVGVYCIGNTSWAIAWVGRDNGRVQSNSGPLRPIDSGFFTDNDYNCKDAQPVPRNSPIGVHRPADSLEALVARENFTAEEADVLRLYRAFFERDPDIDGANYWLGLSKQNVSIDKISEQFARSPEFQNTYGSVDNRRYLEILYGNVLGRQPDAGGFNYWLGFLDSGELSRGGVVRWVAANEEFVAANRYGGR